MKANEYVDRLRKRIKDLEQKVDQLSGDYERWSENEITRLRAEVELLNELAKTLDASNDCNGSSGDRVCHVCHGAGLVPERVG